MQDQVNRETAKDAQKEKSALEARLKAEVIAILPVSFFGVCFYQVGNFLSYDYLSTAQWLS